MDLSQRQDSMSRLKCRDSDRYREVALRVHRSDLEIPCLCAMVGDSQVIVLTGKEPGTFHKLGIGALAGLIAQSCTYPLEVTRRRMQTHGLIDTHAGVNKVTNEMCLRYVACLAALPSQNETESVPQMLLACYCVKNRKQVLLTLGVQGVCE